MKYEKELEKALNNWTLEFHSPLNNMSAKSKYVIFVRFGNEFYCEVIKCIGDGIITAEQIHFALARIEETIRSKLETSIYEKT